jgi:thiol-disulfide isomerase/thioredoxin
MRMVGWKLCVTLAAGVVLPMGSAQAPAPIELQKVKFSGLVDVICRNKGKVIVIDFWADYCLPCKKGFPHLVELHKKYSRDGLVAVSVSLDPIEHDIEQRVLKFLQNKGATFTNLLLDEPPEVWTQRLHTETIPCIYVFNREQKWVQYTGEIQHAEIEKYVAELLRNR